MIMMICLSLPHLFTILVLRVHVEVLRNTAKYLVEKFEVNVPYILQ